MLYRQWQAIAVVTISMLLRNYTIDQSNDIPSPPLRIDHLPFDELDAKFVEMGIPAVVRKRIVEEEKVRQSNKHTNHPNMD